MSNIPKKEIYFGKDVYRDVADKLSLNPKVVEKAFTSFLESMKESLESSNDLVYDVPYLGELMISKGEALRELDKFRRRYYREEDEAEKEKLMNTVVNYRTRVKKIKIELEKFKRIRTFRNRAQRERMYTRKLAISSPENLRRRNLFMGSTLEELVKKQNEYAYKHYTDKNIPITL